MQETHSITTCINHPEVKADFQCQACGVPLCKTCVIIFHENIKYCPKCASLNEGKLSPKRKKTLILSYVAASAATAAILLFFIITPLVRDEGIINGLSYVWSFFHLGASIAGTALGFSSLKKGPKNPFSIYIAVIWNLVLLIFYIILSIIGLTL